LLLPTSSFHRKFQAQVHVRLIRNNEAVIPPWMERGAYAPPRHFPGSRGKPRDRLYPGRLFLHSSPMHLGHDAAGGED